MQPKTAWLECRLNEEELREKGKSLARAEEEKTQNAAAKKAQMAIFKSKDDGLAAVIEKLTTEINNEREYRNVETSELPNYETNLMEIYRRDTGERINTRPLTTDELQLKFGFRKEIPLTEENLKDIAVGSALNVEKFFDDSAAITPESAGGHSYVSAPDGPPGLADEQEEFISEEYVVPRERKKRIVSGWTAEEIAAKDRRVAEKSGTPMLD